MMKDADHHPAPYGQCLPLKKALIYHNSFIDNELYQIIWVVFSFGFDIQNLRGIRAPFAEVILPQNELFLGKFNPKIYGFETGFSFLKW